MVINKTAIIPSYCGKDTDKHIDTIYAMSGGGDIMENNKSGMGDRVSEGWEGQV